MLKRIYIEISNICNVNCSFCPIDERETQVMDLESFERTIKDAAPLAEQICLHLMGEPLAHPKFLGIMELCEKYQAKIQITTNGLLLNRYEKNLLESTAVKQINFSLQAYKDNFPHKNLNDYLRPILDFVAEAQKIKPELYINFRMWNQDSNDHDNKDIFEYVERYFNVSINPNIEVGAIKSKKIINRFYFHFDSRFEWPKLDAPIQGTQGRCNGIIDHIGILANGVVVPCCLDDKAVINLGNCKDQSLKSIMNSPRVNAMRSGFKNGVLVESLCQRCTYINRFKK